MRPRPDTSTLLFDATAPGPAYRMRLAGDARDIRAAQALRFNVFNVELDEGLAASYDTGLDTDAFDAVCDHLLVEDAVDGRVVGTYRMQSGARAASALGWYSAREFDFAPFERHRSRMLELGRACIDRRHRNFAVLNLLWRGIAQYADAHGARWLIGCSSLTSQDPAFGAAAWQHLLLHLAPARWRTRPHAPFACPLDRVAATPPPIPRLLSAYLAIGATVCGPPAIDREFRTIDFLTCLDLHSPTLRALQARGRFTA
ncbi:MAG: GNAT family N-acetyltransferase [Burkholderiales bacterium]|nr:GNAT family N-acetyltransferase [Burkholderiales bacterium]